jgi:hypothetical protein
MKRPNPELELFDGTRAPDEFIEDLEAFGGLSKEVQEEVIRNSIRWYPLRDVDAEWNKWVEGRTEDEKKRLARAVRLILFLTKMTLLKRFSNELLTDELSKIDFKPDLMNLFISEVERNKEDLTHKIERIESPVIPQLMEFNWRIDFKKASAYSVKIDEPSIIIRLSLSHSQTKEVFFEITPNEFSSLVRSFSIIQSELQRLKKG